jgi:hypothetical protein
MMAPPSFIQLQVRTEGWLRLCANGSVGIWRGAFGGAQRQITARVEGAGEGRGRLPVGCVFECGREPLSSARGIGRGLHGGARVGQDCGTPSGRTFGRGTPDPSSCASPARDLAPDLARVIRPNRQSWRSDIPASAADGDVTPGKQAKSAWLTLQLENARTAAAFVRLAMIRICSNVLRDQMLVYESKLCVWVL